MDDAVLFIDANQYLAQLYRIAAGRKLLRAIKIQQEHIFITKQVVHEVQRNKLREAEKLLASQIEQLNQAERCTALGDDVRLKIRATAADLTTNVPELLQQVSRSEDDVSKSLAELFKAAVGETPEELQRARLRKEKGNPPGKPNNPLGDQLTWEQLLSRAKGKSRVWIVSSDGDYCVARGGKRFLNSFLHAELAALNTPPTQVFCFDDLDKGLRDFVKQTHGKADELPTAEESREIEEEVSRIKDEVAAELIPFGWLTSNANARTNAVMQHYVAHDRNHPAFYNMANFRNFTPGMPPNTPHEEPDKPHEE